jgi:septal ring factor EnvC (AmiA/AmiB activator)
MRYPFPFETTLGLCLATLSVAHAADPGGLARACPRLAPINGSPAGEIIIDNATVTRLATTGHIAAITNNLTGNIDPPRSPPTPDNTTKKHWRREHRRCVTAIHEIKRQIAKVESEKTTLRDQFFSLRNEKQRIRLQTAIDAKIRQIDQLKDRLKRAVSGFSRTIRQARKAGARPGWFRDLPRP